MRSLITSVQRAIGTVMPRAVWGGNGGWFAAIRESYAGAWQAGIITPDPLGTLTTFGAVYACVSRIANDIAKLELSLQQAQADGTSLPAPESARWWDTLRRPNAYQNRIQFVSYWIICKALHGNAYGLKQRGALGTVERIYPLDPRRVHPLVAPDGAVYYSLGGDDLARVPTGLAAVPASEIIHDRCVCLWHPLVGVSPLVAAAMSATQGLRIQNSSARFYANMSRPSGMLTAPTKIDDVTADRIKREFEQNYSEGNIGRLAVLGGGLDYKPMTIPAEAAQLVQQLGWTVEDVARCYAVPMYKINAGPMPTAGNVEALEIQYYSGCLQTYMEAFELAFTEGIEVSSGLDVQFMLDGLWRMDNATQMDMLAKGTGSGVFAPNEARLRFNLPPVPGGAYPYLQQQNFSLEALARRDAQPDPFGTGTASGPTDLEDEEDSDEDEEDSDEDEDEAEEMTAERFVAALVKRMQDDARA